MQYDLFHAYTVDAHTLFVVSNLRRFAIRALRPRAAGGLAHHAAAAASREVAYLARAVSRHRQGPRRRSLRARRGGCRSLLPRAGTVALRCAPGGLAGDATTSMLSITSQKQDIGDPQVINAFARKVGDETHLDYLYVLTCADVRGTNPKLWNSWKASLFHDFYQRVKRALRRGLESPIDQEQLVRETQDAARAPAASSAACAEAASSAPGRASPPATSCSTRPRRSPGTRALLAERDAGSDEPLVALDPRSVRGTTAVLIFAPPAPPRLRAHHRGARPARSQHRRCAHHADAATASASTCTTCSRTTARRSPTATGARRSSRRCGARCSGRRMRRSRYRGARRARRACSTRRRRSRISVDERNRRSVLELTAGDRPGPAVRRRQGADAGARRAARRQDHDVGERAEDVFYVTDLRSNPWMKRPLTRLRARLTERARPAPWHESASGARCRPIHSSGCAHCWRSYAPPAQLAPISLVDRRAAARAAARSCWQTLAQHLDAARQLSRHRAACRNCAPPGARRCSGAACRLHGSASIRTPWCCRSTAPARRCSHSCRRWSIRGSDAAGGHAESLLPDLRGRSAAGRGRALLSRTPPPPTATGRISMPCRRGCLAPLPGAVPVLTGQSHRRGAAAGLPAACAGSGRAPRLHRGRRRVLRRYLPRRGPAPPACCRPRSRPGTTAFERCIVFHSLSKRSSLPGLALGFRGRRSGPDRALPAVPHLSRQRHAAADAAGEHRGLGG